MSFFLYRYYNYALLVNGKWEHHGQVYKEDYLTDVMGRKAHDFLDGYLATDERHRQPFLMFLSTPAAHGPYTPAPQYGNEFPQVMAPRSAQLDM